MTVVIGTAGHIDHGKTSLLRALTGMDADRLPEEQRRGMTIDVGYAHAALADGSEIDFVDVPGHDRLIGNMLVGAGEIDAAMLVVAADDGPRAQTLEHLGLLDALGIDLGFAVVTKIDLVDAERRAEVAALVRGLLDGASLRRAPVVAASSVTMEGIDAVRSALAAFARPAIRRGPVRLAVDRVFSVRGRGVVVTGSLRGGPVARGDVLRVEPLGHEVRVREVQVHNRAVERAEGGGRVALNLAGTDVDALRRGLVLTTGAGVERSERLLVALRPAAGATPDLRHGLRVRVHAGTEQVDGVLDLARRASVTGTDGRRTAIVRLDEPIAAAFGDALVLRRPSPGETLAGATVLDPVPPRGVSRRRMTEAALGRLLAGTPGSGEHLAALAEIHGVLPGERVDAWQAIRGAVRMAGPWPGEDGRHHRLVASDVTMVFSGAAVAAVGTTGADMTAVRAAARTALRRTATVADADATVMVDEAIRGLVSSGALVRSGDRLLPAGASAGPDPVLVAAMERLEAMLAVAAPPSLREAALAARCPIEGIRALESAGRIVRVEDDLAWEVGTLRRFWLLALRLATPGPLSPAAFRDATGTSRRFALAILEDLDRRAVLRRTPAGHVPGPRASSVEAAGGAV